MWAKGEGLAEGVSAIVGAMYENASIGPELGFMDFRLRLSASKKRPRAYQGNELRMPGSLYQFGAMRADTAKNKGA